MRSVTGLDFGGGNVLVWLIMAKTPIKRFASFMAIYKRGCVLSNALGLLRVWQTRKEFRDGAAAVNGDGGVGVSVLQVAKVAGGVCV